MKGRCQTLGPGGWDVGWPGDPSRNFDIFVHFSKMFSSVVKVETAGCVQILMLTNV